MQSCVRMSKRLECSVGGRRGSVKRAGDHLANGRSHISATLAVQARATLRTEWREASSDRSTRETSTAVATRRGWTA